MARYIDAEALTDYMLERYNDLCEKHGDCDHYTTGYGDAIDVIEIAPTADVVPKSEVVREIFEEIDDLMIDHARGDIDNHWLYVGIEKLKKKYTEGGEDK